MRTHGMCFLPIYKIWRNIRSRCQQPSNILYENYGGKGISVDPKWATFEGFHEDMGATWKEGLTLRRLDTSGDYTRENCCWDTGISIRQHSKSARQVTYKGETLCLSEWCRRLGIKYITVHNYIRRKNLSVTEAFEKAQREASRSRVKGKVQ